MLPACFAKAVEAFRLLPFYPVIILISANNAELPRGKKGSLRERGRKARMETGKGGGSKKKRRNGKPNWLKSYGRTNGKCSGAKPSHSPLPSGRRSREEGEEQENDIRFDLLKSTQFNVGCVPLFPRVSRASSILTKKKSRNGKPWTFWLGWVFAVSQHDLSG